MWSSFHKDRPINSASPNAPPLPSTLVELLRLRSLHQPDHLAYTFLLDGERKEATISYNELDRRARAIGAKLQGLGAKGEPVLLLYPPGLDYISAFFGCMYAGSFAVPVYSPRTNRTLARLLSVINDSQATFALTNSAVLDKAKTLLDENSQLKTFHWLNTDDIEQDWANRWSNPDVDGDTLALLQYTSGSTGSPKGVMVSHSNILCNEYLIQQAFQQTEQSIIVSWLPMYHDMGLIGGILQPLYLGVRCILMSPVAFLQRPLRWLQAISRFRATTSGGPDFAFDLCAGRITAEERSSLDLSSWAVAFNGAEPIRAQTLERFSAAFEPCGFKREAFTPCYGLAEATLIVSAKRGNSAPVIKPFHAPSLDNNTVEVSADGKDARLMVSSGRGLPGEQIIVVDLNSLTRCPECRVGEIWVSGPSVAQGYWNKPGETENTFRARLSDTGEGPFLRTGDLGFIRDGELFITGRLKDLIIIRGLNYYPQDIEITVEQSHPAFIPHSGAAFSIEVAGQERLVIVQEMDTRHGLSAETAVDIIRQGVADNHDLQVFAIALIKRGSMPKTSSGKIQHHACRSRFLEGRLDVLAEWREDSASEFAPPADPYTNSFTGSGDIEGWLISHISKLLKVKPSLIQVDQPIPHYGLDSLAATELAHSIESHLSISIPMAVLLDSPTIADLARQLKARLNIATQKDGLPVDSAGVSSTASRYPLSLGQRALWFLYEMAPLSPAYNVARAVRVVTGLNTAALKRAFDTLIERHPSLRTTFLVDDGAIIQQVQDQLKDYFRVEDTSMLGEPAFNQHLVDEAHRVFNLREGPMIRVSVFKRPANDHIVLLVFHHIIIDFWSIAILARELRELYSSEVRSVPPALPPPASTYADFINWQSEMLAGPEGERLFSYWREELATDLPPLDLPTDRPRRPSQSFNGATLPFKLNAELTDVLKQVGGSQNATLYMTLLAAFQCLLHHYTAQEKFLVGSITSGRRLARFANTVGYFVNPVTLRAEFSIGPTFEEHLRQVKQTALAAFEHQDYPFGLLVEKIRPVRDPSTPPLFQAMFILQKSQPPDDLDLAAFAMGEAGARMSLADLTIESVALEHRGAQFDLSLMMAETNGGLAASLQYNTDLFDAETMARFAGHFQNLLEEAATYPSRRVTDLQILSRAERQQLLEEWNNTRVSYPRGLCIHQLFEARADLTPEATALVFDDGQVTYQVLNNRANQLAHYLRSLKVGPEACVGICFERGANMIVGMLGVLKAGGAYVPLDPQYPKQRLAFMLNDARPAALITQKSLLGQLPECEAKVICLDQDWQLISRESEVNPRSHVRPENLAYVIYTSGSTGKPKGVAIEHRNAVSFINWASGHFSQEELSGVLASTSICFDLSVFEIFVPLSVGGRVILARNVLLLEAIASSQNVKLINTVPSAMAELLRLGTIPPGVLTVNLAGEPLPNDLAQQVYGRGVKRVVNLYGPSEDTTYSTYAELEAGVSRSVPIGKPIANSQAHVLNKGLGLVPIGVAGEIHLAGEGLARGYLNLSDQTAEKFLPNPYGETAGGRLYKTGDLGRHLPDGNIEYLGRKDHQVKIRGYRIETGEVEAALQEHPAVRQSVVAAREDTSGNKRLIAYLVVNTGSELNLDQLKAHLGQKLPGYMVPAAFVTLDELPVMPNGKIDRKVLPAPQQSRADLDQGRDAPRTAVEEVLASIWADVLEVDAVGVNDNFFQIGGHSLLASQAVHRIRETFEVELSLPSLFETPTVASLAASMLSDPVERKRIERIAELILKVFEYSETEVETLLNQDPS